MVFHQSLLALGLVLVLIISFRPKSLKSGNLPKSVEWATKGRSLFSMLKTIVYSMYSIRDTLHKGYNNFSRHGKPFILAHWNLRPRVILPYEHIPWITSQPEHVLSHKKVDFEQLAIEYTHDPRHCDFGMRKIFSKELSRTLPQLHATILDEASQAIDRTFGHDQGWKSKNVILTTIEILSAINYRVIFGDSLSRDKALIHHAACYNFWFGIMGNFAGQIAPRPIKSVVAMLVAVPLKYHLYWVRRRLEPVILDRLRAYPNSSEKGATRADGIGWAVNVAVDSQGTSAIDASDIATFFIESVIPITNFPTIATSNFILDLMGADPRWNLQQSLRTEADSFFQNHASHPTSTTNHLRIMDSCFRETLRIRPFVIYGLGREVIPEEGVFAPDGTHLPQGTWVCVSNMDIHLDDRLYEDPDTFNPYRFLNTTATGEVTPKAMLSTASPSFLAFGYGDYVCPGRVYASQMLKTVAAYMVAHYDFEARPCRKTNWISGMIQAPAYWANFTFRRRQNYAPAPC